MVNILKVAEVNFIILSSYLTCREVLCTVFTLKEFPKFQRYLPEPSWIFPRSRIISYSAYDPWQPHRESTCQGTSSCLCYLNVFQMWDCSRLSKAGFSKLQAKSSPHLSSFSLERRHTYTSGMMCGSLRTTAVKWGSCYRDLWATKPNIFTIWPFKSKLTDACSKVYFNHEAPRSYYLREIESQMS